MLRWAELGGRGWGRAVGGGPWGRSAVGAAARAGLGWALACAALWWLSGCGYAVEEHRWDRRYVELERLMDHGQILEARAGFEALQHQTTRPADRRMIEYRLAVLLEREGRWREAVRAYELLWNEGERDEISGHAVFRAAQVMYAHLGAPEEGLRLWEGLLKALPEVVAADRALQAILAHWEGQGDTQMALRVIDRLYRSLRETRIGDNLLFSRAAISRRRGEGSVAIVAYERLLERYPTSGLRDDARWLMAEIHREAGRHEAALIQLKLLAEDREVSWQLGSYDSELTDDARFRRGVIYLDDLRDPTGAEVEFARFVREFPESLLRDDARWNIVQARLRRGDGAAAARGCEALVREEPRSRWVDDCHRVVEALGQGASASSMSGRAVVE